MKRLAIIVIAAALAWSAHWAYQANATRSAIETWFETRRADGWTARYDTLSLRGFPNRLDVTLTDIAVQAPDGPLWTAPFFQSFQLVFNPGHRIFAFPETMGLGATTVTSQGLRASLVGRNGLIDRANIEAQVLNLQGEASTVALAGLTGAFAQTTAPATYQIDLAAEGLAGPKGPLPGGSDPVSLRSVIAFDHPWHSRDALETRPQPRRIDVETLEFGQGGLTLKLAGALDIDASGKGTGRVTLRLENWRAFLDKAETNGTVGPGFGQALRDGLTLYSQLTGNGEDLDLPLDFKGGEMRLGPVPLGQGPAFRLP